MSEFKVKLIDSIKDPQLLSVAGALGCFEEKSSFQLLNELLVLPGEERLKKERGVLKNSFGRGHGSVGDQNYFVFSIEDLPRIATLQLCLPEYLAHLQQSLRRAKASRGFYLPESIKNSPFGKKVEEILFKSFELYDRMSQAGIPMEDGRFLLPLYTKTNIQTVGNARELCHLLSMSRGPRIPSIVNKVVEEMISQAKEKTPLLFEDFGFNYERLSWYPSSQLYAETNQSINSLIQKKGDKDKVVFLEHIFPKEITSEAIKKAVKNRDEAELSNLKHVHFEFLVPMSLACFHQATRQRTWDHSIETIYDAAKEGVISKERMVMPPSIKNSSFALEYEKQHQDMLNLYDELVGGGIPAPEAIGVVPHSLKIYDWIHINGWNAIHSIGKRTCLEAQGEIRIIAWQIAKYIKDSVPAFKNWAEPQCITYGKCPEIKDCGYYKKNIKQ